MKYLKQIDFKTLESGDIIVCNLQNTNWKFYLRILNVYSGNIEKEESKEEIIFGLNDEVTHIVLCINSSLKKCIEYLEEIWQDIEIVEAIKRYDIKYDKDGNVRI